MAAGTWYLRYGVVAICGVVESNFEICARQYIEWRELVGLVTIIATLATLSSIPQHWHQA